jgi:PPIC-type PPIASE domain
MSLTLFRRWAYGLAAAGVAGFALAQSPAPQPGRPAAGAAAAPDDYATRPVAYIYGSVPVTRADLGEFLIARGGADKLELLVNRMIIEHECKIRGITVTDKEMEAALQEDCDGIKVQRADFIKMVLPRYGKTLYEWMEDVVRPRLLLSKLCHDQVKLMVTEEDLKKQFERMHGEKRQVQVVIWPKGEDMTVVRAEWAKMRSSQEEFDRVARAQANPSLAATAGTIQPLSRHVYAEDAIVVTKAFELKPGEVSELLATSQGTVVLKMHKVIPADDKVKFEDKKTLLYKQALEEKMAEAIPQKFGELKKKATPQLLLSGPDKWRMERPAQPAESVLKGVEATAPAAGTPPTGRVPTPGGGK